MAMMMTGKIRSSSKALSTKGKTNAATISSAGSPYFLSRATALLTAPLHRGAVS
jgi:preprotein translocase subunit SecG